MKILAFAGSNSSTSINRQLVTFASTFFSEDKVTLIDLNDYEMPIYSADRERESGIPRPAWDFSHLIEESDLILLSLAEHNGAYSTAFKNIFDWMSRIPEHQVWSGKPIFLMATSPGGRGGASVLEIAGKRFPRNGGIILETFSLPYFNENFSREKGIIHPGYREELITRIARVKETVNPKPQ